MSEGRVTVGDPVDVGSGAVFTLSADFRIPGSLDIYWLRHYSTIALRDLWLGVKWTVPYFMTLERRDDRYILVGSHGDEVTFLSDTPLCSGAVLANLSCSMELRCEDGYFSVLHWHTGGKSSRFCFKVLDQLSLPLSWIENMAGHKVIVEYNRDSRPARLVQQLERRVIEIDYGEGNLIDSISLLTNTGRKLLVGYEYDGRRLIGAFDAMGHRKHYEYDHNVRLIAEANPLGSRFVFEYDRLGRCTRTAGDDGFMERKLQYFAAPPMTRVTDSAGAVTEYYLNPAGQVVQRVDPDGSITTKTFDQQGRLAVLNRPDGSQESHVYDDKGNRVESFDPSGAKTTVSHNALHAPVGLVDRNGNAWKLSNQYEGSLAGLENLPHGIWNYDWDDRRLVRQARRFGGRTITIRRNEDFRWQEISDKIALLARTEFDEFGHPTTVVDADGFVSNTTYDALHRVVETRRDQFEPFRYEWNAIGKRTGRIGPNNQRDTWQYNKYGYLVAQSNALAHEVQFEYDNEGKLSAITSRTGERLEYLRDTLGRVIREKLFDGRTQFYEYDLLGRRIGIQLSDGRMISQKFDTCGRLVSRQSSDGLVEEFSHDKEGRVIEARNEHSSVKLKRDRFGRILEENQSGRHISYRYNSAGNRIRRSLPFGVAGSEIQREFDSRGRLVAVHDERGVFQEFRWDSLDRLRERRCAGGVLEAFQYDSEGRVLRHQVESRLGRVTRDHTYDSSGNLECLQDSRKGALTFAYDRTNRLVAVWGGALPETYEYNAGNAISRTHRGIHELAPGGKVLHDGSRCIGYGGDGAIATMHSDSFAYALKHDVDGRLVQVTQPNGHSTSYEYDPFGRRTAKVVGKSRTEFFWEGWSLAAETRNGGDEIIYLCADLRPLAQWESGERLTPILDGRGAVQELFDESGRQCWSGTLDAYGNLLGEGGSPASPFRLRGQYHDRETGFYYNFHRHYDPRLGDYTSPDPLGVSGGHHLYAYPRNPMRWADPFGLTCNDPEKHKDDPQDEEPPSKPATGPAPVGDPPAEQPPGAPAEEPDSRAVMKQLADAARDEDPRPNTVARIENADGSVVTGQSQKGEGSEVHPAVQAALDQVPVNQQSDHHGKCAEIDAMSNNASTAQANGQDPAKANEGALIQTAQVRGEGGDQSRQGAPQTPCSSCKSVMNQLGAGYNPR